MPLLETKGAASARGYGLLSGQGGSGAVIEDVFSTWLYTGNNSTQTITNGIDLSGKGGLVWTKSRTYGNNGGTLGHHVLWDSSVQLPLNSNTTNAASVFNDTATSGGVDSFTSTGFVSSASFSGADFATWTFRKQPKFFDVVTYTGNGSNRTIAHNLGEVPGCIIVKRTDTAGDWQVYHRSLANTEYMVLNSTAAKATGATRWNSTTPTSTEFSLGTDTTVNASGGTYVAYLFAHDAGGFGASGTDNVISCGLQLNANRTVDLGWEPQWILAKRIDLAGDWYIDDNMRGWPAAGANDNPLLANSSAAEPTGFAGFASTTSTGFRNNFNGDYIYIAIRRGPMRVPTVGTSVFSPNAVTSSSGNTTVTAGFPVDLSILKLRDFADGARWIDRLRGITSSTTPEFNSTLTSAEFTSTDIINAGQTTVQIGPIGTYSCVNWNFRRAPGFFDVVAFRGSSSTFSVPHNLTAVPSLILIKKRIDVSSAGFDGWWVLSSEFSGGFISGGSTSRLVLNTDAAVGIGVSSVLNSLPTSTQLPLLPSNFNASDSFIAYLFATCPGVSKVGSYTGNGSSQTINCGFTGGARFVMIKRTDSAGDWYVWDTARGIVAGNDPHLRLNSTAAEVTTDDSVDTDSTGFVVNQVAATNVNVSSATYIFLAVA